jgi:hypothetical protein
MISKDVWLVLINSPAAAQMMENPKKERPPRSCGALHYRLSSLEADMITLDEIKGMLSGYPPVCADSCRCGQCLISIQGWHKNRPKWVRDFMA